MLSARDKREEYLLARIYDLMKDRGRESTCNNQKDKYKDREMFRQQAGQPRRRDPTSDQRVDDLWEQAMVECAWKEEGKEGR